MAREAFHQSILRNRCNQFPIFLLFQPSFHRLSTRQLKTIARALSMFLSDKPHFLLHFTFSLGTNRFFKWRSWMVFFFLKLESSTQWRNSNICVIHKNFKMCKLSSQFCIILDYQLVFVSPDSLIKIRLMD